MLRLQPLRWWDIPTLTGIEADLFGVDAWSAETFWGELAGIPETRWYRVAVADDEIVGYVGLAAIAGTGDVQTIAVRRDRQGTGVAGLLLDALLTEAEVRACSEVLLEVRADNAPAIRLYERRGFERIAERPRYYSDGVTAWIMRRVPAA